jgi:hypothetical protein
MRGRPLFHRVKVTRLILGLPREHIVAIRHVEVDEFDRSIDSNLGKTAAFRAPCQIVFAPIRRRRPISGRKSLR